MNIYTRTGDKGETSLRDGCRIKKSDQILEALGNLDELNCFIGLSARLVKNLETRDFLVRLQNLLLEIGAYLADPKSKSRDQLKILPQDIKMMENLIDRMEEGLEPIRRFILPGGSKNAVILHLSRAVCRRTERSIVRSVNPRGKQNQAILAFINRLSDFLFVLARLENKISGQVDNLWRSSASAE